MLKNAEFKISVADSAKIPNYGKPELAIAGKSNVGKSSLINYLTNRKKLARTSSEPGRTRLLNYFEINGGEFYIVDLPGYGFARVSKDEKLNWGAMVEGYLKNSPNLRNVFFLLDVRHDPSADDLMMLNYLFANHIEFTIICTKCDKLSTFACNARRTAIANTLGLGKDNVMLASTLNRKSFDVIWQRIDQIVGKPTD